MFSFTKIYLPALLAVVSLFSKAQGIADFVPTKPAYPRMYNDENAYAYYHPVWRRLEDKLIYHHKRTGNQFVIVVIPSTGGYPVEEIATETFRRWGIGDKEKNNGLLLLIARKEKQIRIETGYGLEGDIPDIIANRIIEDILKPGLDSFNFILPAMHPQKGYLPIVEITIDTLISFTNERNEAAEKNITTTKNNKQQKKLLQGLLIVTGVVAGLLIFKKGWGLLNNRLTNSNDSPAVDINKRNKRRKYNRTIAGQYIYPGLILVALLAATIFLEWRWLYFILASIFLFLRWIYHLQPPKLSAETMRFNKEWEGKRKMLKAAYAEKKKQLGSEKLYKNFDAYRAKYLALGLDKLEKELQVGHYVPKAQQPNKGYKVGDLLYDIFLGISKKEKRGSFSSTNTKGYNGKSTSGQSAGDFGGGSSGGGGASA